ncbi:hypothetical protein ACIPSA_46605 [Streptomyces sp. NPDC086549]|uniref:hypothetical protein n=1 Tax=Streptomyces sp. NPDC086549 TaxID=3365752 RepID=UPI00380C8BD5
MLHRVRTACRRVTQRTRRHRHCAPRVLEDLGARLVDEPACRFLDEPPLFEALQEESQDARTGTAQDRCRAVVRTLEAQWRSIAADTPTPTA